MKWIQKCKQANKQKNPSWTRHCRPEIPGTQWTEAGRQFEADLGQTQDPARKINWTYKH
jgi:hypothetical protein